MPIRDGLALIKGLPGDRQDHGVLFQMARATAKSGVFGIRVSCSNMQGLLDELSQPPERTGKALSVVTANVDHVVTLRKNATFREAYDNAWRVTVDGMPVFVFAKLRGIDVQERVPGSDIIVRFFERPLIPGFRYFFVTSSDATSNALKATLVKRGVDERAVATVVPPFGFHQDADYSRELAGQIASHGTTHLFMGVGAPKSEIWVERHKHLLGSCYALCVGAGLDYFAAERTRAPIILQKTGLEWLWRLGSEPRRLTKRYLLGAVEFSQAIVQDLRAPKQAR